MKKFTYALILCFLWTNIVAQNNKRNSAIQQADKVYEQGMKQYKSGNYAAALESFDESLVLEKDISKELDPRYQNLLIWKAGCLYKQGKIDQAKAVSPDYYLIDPIDRAKTLEADSLSMQAQDMLNNGNSLKALALLQSEAEIEKKVVGDKHVYYANTLRNIADVFLMCSDGKSALTYYHSYKDIITPIYGKKSKFYAAALDGISSSCSFDSIRWNEAVDLHEKAQALYDSLGIAEQERPYIANVALLSPAITYYKAKDYKNAIKFLSLMKDNLLMDEKNRTFIKGIYGKANDSFATDLFSKNEYESAIPYFEKSVFYGDSINKISSYLCLGICRLRLKQYEKSKGCLLQVIEHSKDSVTKQMACRFMGDVYYYESCPFEVSQEYAKALDGYLLALKWFKDGGKPSQYVKSLRDCAGIYSCIKEWEKSDSLYQVALKIALTAKDTMGVSRTYYDMASMCCKKNDYNQALKYLDQCYQLCMEIQDYPFAFATSSKKANLYISDLNNDYLASVNEKQCENLLKLMDAGQKKIYQSDIYFIRKEIQTQKGDYSQALMNLEKLHTERLNAMQFSESSVLDSTAEYALYFKEKINLLYKLNRTEEIRSCLDSLLSFHKNYSLEKKADEYATIGGFYLLIHDYDASVANLKKSIQIYQQLDKNERRCEKPYYYMGVTYANQKKFDEAQNALEKALSINMSYEPTYNKDKENILYVLANVCAFGKSYNKAQGYYSKTVDLLKTIIKRDFAFLTEQERDGYWKSLQEDLLDISAFGYKMKAFDCSFTTELYNSVLFSKGLLLNSDNEISKLVSKNPGLMATRSELNKLQQEIELKQTRGTNIDSLLIKRQTMESDLLEKCNALYGNYTKFLSIDFKDIVSRLGKTDIALEFHDFRCGKDSTMYCAFVLKQGMNNPQMVPLFEKRDLDNLLLVPSCTFSSAFTCNTDSGHNYIYRSKELGKLVWGKILPYLSDVHCVYFSPSGVFHQLGIENLPLEDGRTFSDHYAAYRLSSTREMAMKNGVPSSNKVDLYGGLQYDEKPQTMLEMSRENRRGLELSDNLTLAFGDSLSLYKRAKAYYRVQKDSSQTKRGNFEVDELPYTKEEVTGINAILSSANVKNLMHTTLYLGAKGNEESFKALSGTHPRIIHIATHGFFLPQENAEEFSDKRSFLMGLKEQQQQKADVDFSLSRSGLVMAGGRKAWMGEAIPDSVDDGILTAREIAYMDLRGTDLIVLSACETGLGDVTGEGVFGLQRGFKKAGVNTLVMSLWKVDDKATQMMMTQFYNNLMKGQSKRSAFLNAQQYLREYKISQEDLTRIASYTAKGKKEEQQEHAGEMDVIHPYASPRYWAAFIMLDGIK